MKFIDYLTSVAGVGIFPLISLLVFFVFFLLLGIYVAKADKQRLNYLAAIPVNDEIPNEKNNPDNISQ